ncbi:MAG: hypothetical protein ACI9VI_001086 [Candidatus Azotimanducaceae bacterium]|jgi:uncharacterized protein
MQESIIETSVETATVTESVREENRIQSLDVLRGFALLGILLLNIIGFGLLSPSYSNPGFDLVNSSLGNIVTWASVEIFAEGSMRCLFSILFGAGIVLFTGGAKGKGAFLHYSRTFWLLIFGLFDAFILLWNGDILITYAIAGAVLYLFRNASVKTLILLSSLLIFLASSLHFVAEFGLGKAYSASQAVSQQQSSESLNSGIKEGAEQWQSFAQDFTLDKEGIQAEINARGTSYQSAFIWNQKKTLGMMTFVLPLYLFWDALMMMLLGMALYKAGVLQGDRDNAFYIKLMIAGFTIGLLTNSYEVQKAIESDWGLHATFAQMQFTYHIGRLAMALGYLGLIVYMVKNHFFANFQNRLAAVGRMALTNYLMQSLMCAVLFTGLGFSLVGQLERSEIYLIVLGIWIFQMIYSVWWLERYKFGPVEWLWRMLTYGKKPSFVRKKI